MRNLNFLRKSERKSVGTTLALTVGSPSAHRRYSALKHLTFMLLFLLGSLNVWGGTSTYTFSSNAWASSVSTGGTSCTWSGSANANQYSSTQNPIGAQITTGKNGLTITSSISFTNVTEVVVKYNSTKNGVGSIGVQIGSTTITAKNISKSQSNTELSFTPSTATSGTIVVTFNCSTNSYAIVSVAVTTSDGTQQPTACADPEFSLAAGSYEGAQSVEITCATDGATIYYTTNGSDPTTSSAVYSTAIPVTANTTIKAYAVKADLDDSQIAEAAYTITAGPDVTLDFTSNGWSFPTTKTLDEGSFTSGDYTIKVAGGASGTGYNFDSNHLFFGKKDAYIELPTFDRTITKIVVVGVENGSGSVTFNLFQGTTAVSTAVTSCKVDQTFEIAEAMQKADVAHFIRLTNDNNARFAKIKIYLGAEPEKYAVTLAADGGTLTATKGGNAFASGTEVVAGTELVLTATPDETHTTPSSIVVTKTVGDDEVTSAVYDSENNKITVPEYAITVSASFAPKYAITAANVTGGSFSWEDDAQNANPAYVAAGTYIQASANNATGYTFGAFDIYKTGEPETKVEHTEGLFEMPAYAVTIGGSFDKNADPEITLSQTEDFVFDDVEEGGSASKTFTVSAANLSNNITVTVSGDDADKFGLSTNSITISEGGVENAEVTITPVTTAAGTFEATITVDDGVDGATAQSFDVAITVLPKYTAKWIVNGDTENPYSSQTAIEGADLNIPNNPTATGNCAGLTFMGWVSEAIEGSQDEAPSYVNTEGLKMPSNDVTYYAVFAEEVPGEDEIETYSHTIEAKTWSSAGAQTLSSVAWTLANDGNYYNYDATKGQQVGSGGAPASAMSLTTSGISGKITSVKIYTSGANSVSATVAASVNGVAYKNNNSASPVAISSTNTGYEFTGSETGEIVISWAQTSSKAIYFKQIEVKYATPGAPTYSNYVTTCSTCAKVTLSAGNAENGSIAFQQDSKAVEVVKTCNAAQSVDVVATPAIGYELTGVELSGVTGANYSDGVISIPQNAEGTLVATASFAQINYSVAMAQEGGANATISADQSDKHYGDEITVTAHEKEGYIFAGWEATPAVTFADAKALETTFSMPNGNVTVTAKYSKVLTVAEALALIPNSGDDSDGDVYVQAFVSYVNASSFDADYGTQHYYLSDNGARENELMVYYGYKGANSEKFTASNEIKAGDKVIVCGPLTNYNGTKEFKTKSSYIHELTSASHASYEIVGELTQNAFAAGDEFLDSYLANLKVNDVYNTGYKVEVADVTFSANKTALGAEDEAVHVTATKNDATLAEKDFAITVSSATLVSFALKDGYKTEYYVGEAFVKPIVIATLSDESHVEAEALSCTGYNMSEAGNYEVTVSYKYGDITLNNVQYNITVKSIFGNEDAPHTVAVAKALIEASAYQEKVSSTDYMWVRGKVVSEPNSSSTYYISDDGTSANQLTVWQGKYFTTDVSAKGNVAQGDEVILKATIVNYNGNQAELTASTVVYQLREPAFAIADIVAGDEFEAGYSEDLAVEPTDNDGDAEFALSSGNTGAVTIVEGKLHAVAAGDAVITATRAATANENALNYKEATTTFNVHVIAERDRYTVSFDKNGGTGTDPVIENQLEGATVDMPAACPYNYDGYGFTGWKVINLNTEAEIDVENDQFEMPAANVKIQAQWAEVATCRISFQVNGAEVAHANAPQEADYNITQVGAAVDGFTFLGWSETEYADEVETLPTMISVYHAQAGEENKVLYGIYKREQVEDHGHYVLNYTDDVADKTLAYGSAVEVTATNGSKWIVKAYKSNGMQINTGKNASIKIPTCPGKIFSIAITTSTTKSVGLSASDYSGTGTISYIKYGTDATSQTLDLSSETVTAGYIVPKGGNAIITNIDVEFDASKTYYTSSPVEKVTITFNVNGGNGGCTKAVINKGSEFTICENVPTKSHSEFAGWKLNETTTIYQANQNIGEVEEDITLTAQWDAASTYTVTYEANGATAGIAPTDATEYYAGDDVTVLGKGDLKKDDYDFQGWKYDGKLYAAGASFTMPANIVEFVAQWKKQSVSTEQMTLVTDASVLVEGMEIVLGCSYGESAFAMAGDITGTNKYMSSISGNNVTFSDGVATYTEDVVVMTLEKAGNGWKITKDGSNYLTLTGSDIKWDTQANATIWTIDFIGNNVNIANGNNKLQFNSNNPRFKTYTSNQTAIMLFGKAMVVTNDVAISDLGYVEGDVIVVNSGAELNMDVATSPASITVKDGATVTISAATEVNNMVVENGGTIDASSAVEVNNLYIEASAVGSSAQVINAANIALATGGDVFFDLTLGAAGKRNAQWHAFTVPFEVDAVNGVYDVENNKLTNEVNYAIMDYHGDIRANGQYGWKKFRGILQPGVFYIMTVDGERETYRFKKANHNAFTAPASTIPVTAYSGSGDNTDQGWNGVGNPNLIYGKVNANVQVLDPDSYEFEDKDPNTVNFTVGTPFFYQATATTVLAISEANATANYAPARYTSADMMTRVYLKNENYSSRLTITSSEDATNEYQAGKDLVKMTMTNTPSVPRITAEAYNTKLCRIYTPMVNDQAEVALSLYAPAAGEYTIAAPEESNAYVYLTKDGVIIWNLSNGEYTADMKQGNNEGYGIRIVKAPNATTGIGNAEAGEAGVQKVVIDNNVYILRGEKMYDATGRMVK